MDGVWMKRITNIGWVETLGDHFGEIVEISNYSKELTT